MPRVIIESPYRGENAEERQKNIKYLQLCLQDSVRRGEVPFASHGFFPLFLNEDNAQDRELGIKLGFAFWTEADKIVFYTDRGISPGMEKALLKAFKMGKPIERRQLHGGVADQFIEAGQPEQIPDEVLKYAPKFKPALGPVDLDQLRQKIDSKEDLQNKSGPSEA